MFKHILIVLSIISVFNSNAQEAKIEIQKSLNWNQAFEGKEIKFKLDISPDSVQSLYNFGIQQGKIIGMELNSTGEFSWTPNYNLVDRIESERLFQIIVAAKTSEGQQITNTLDIYVKHTNRPPVLNELKTFYVQFNYANTYTINNNLAYDEDLDPIVFVPNLETLPEGMTMSTLGEINWKPSQNQFKGLKEKPIFIEFFVQDQPSKSITKGKLKIEATQMDLPPQITVIPKNEHITTKENENVNIRFYLTDPNGEDDVAVFDFLTNQPGIEKKSLIKNTNNQYEFIWIPGYDFVQDPKDTLGFYIDFFVLDKTQKREVKRILFTVKNTINEAETDAKSYGLYFGTLQRAWELMEQLKEKEEELKKAYNRSKKGKKQRSVVNASLGATTGLSSIFTKSKPDTQRLISTFGGTTVLTIGTLEATEVIGKSMKDLIDRLNYVIEKKNELQTKGDIFARDYSLKSARRNLDFIKKVDDFMATMNLKGLVALELNATWEAKKKPTENNIQKTFKDFAAW
jgi:hypothetical protein